MTRKKKLAKPFDEPSLRFASLLAPVTTREPCGCDLEYDPEFVVLQARATPREEAQYGDFVAQRESIDWSEVDRDCQRLLQRSKDLRVLVLLLRSRTRLEGAAGVCDVLALMRELVKRYPNDVHPRLEGDGEPDAALRVNALAALLDPEGFMSDLREVPLSGSLATRLRVRDVERAMAASRAPDALSADSVQRQLDELRATGSPMLAALDGALQAVEDIDAWARSTLQDASPDLTPITILLRTCTRTRSAASAIEAVPPRPPEGPSPIDDIPELPGVCPSRATPESGICGRADALAQIHDARMWFEQNEPSSPVALLLKEAERLVGKRFDQVFQSIPAELVARWGEGQ
ncbi:MAG: type VI secretion system protein TssA [Rhodocyclaceae bacterium]